MSHILTCTIAYLKDIYINLRESAFKEIKDALEKKGQSFINVQTYTEEGLIETPCIHMTDKDGYGRDTTIDAIYKDDDGKWYLVLVDEDENHFGTYGLTELAEKLEANELIGILELLNDIFNYADEYCAGVICGKDQSLEEVEDNDEKDRRETESKERP